MRSIPIYLPPEFLTFIYRDFFKIFKMIEFDMKDSGKLPLILAKVMLSYLCLWPPNKKKIVIFFRYLMFFNVTIMTIPHLIYMLKNITNIGVMASTCTTVSTSIQTVSKMFLIHYHSKELEEMLRIISEEFWPANIAGDKAEQNVLSGSKLVILMVCIYISTAFLSCWDFMAIPLVFGRRILPLESSLPFVWDVSPLFEIIYVWHFLSNSFIVVHTIASHDFFLNSMLMNCISQFKLLKAVLKTIGRGECKEMNRKLTRYGYLDRKVNCGLEEEEDYKLVIKCVQHHLKIIKICSTLERLYGIMIFLQFFLSATAICVSTFVLTKFDNYLTKMLSFSAAHLIQFFFLCAIGNEIIHQSVSVADAAYESKWYNKEYPEVRRALSLMIQRATHREQKLTAIGIANLDFPNFINVLRLSFSFYTLLSNLKEK